MQEILTNDQRQVVLKIIGRAKDMNMIKDSLISTLMDIESAVLHFNMRLQDWLEADDFNFAHDFYGIINCIVRDEFPSVNFGYFLPRFAGRGE